MKMLKQIIKYWRYLSDVSHFDRFRGVNSVHQDSSTQKWHVGAVSDLDPIHLHALHHRIVATTLFLFENKIFFMMWFKLGKSRASNKE